MLKKLLTSLIVCAILATSLCYAKTIIYGTAKVSAYCRGCDSSGVTRSGKKFKDIKYAFCAADKAYWKPGTKIYFPVLKKHYIIEDTGSAIKGKHRFDLFIGNHTKCKCNSFGIKRLQYQVVYISKRGW